MGLGMVPNGARVYYKERSQPPLLTQMVYSYVDYQRRYNDTWTGIEELKFLEWIVPVLTLEYDWWMTVSY